MIMSYVCRCCCCCCIAFIGIFDIVIDIAIVFVDDVFMVVVLNVDTNLKESSTAKESIVRVVCNCRLLLRINKLSSSNFKLLEVCNIPMTPHVRLLVGWLVCLLVGRSAIVVLSQNQ